MGLLAAYIMPHPPLAVDGIGGEAEKSGIPETLFSYDKLAREIAELRPDTIILTSPHSVIYNDYFHISPGEHARGDFGMFGAPSVSMECKYDSQFVKDLSMFCQDTYFPAGTDGETDAALDHGTMVPLYFVNKYYTDYELVRIGLSGLPLKEHYLFGKFIKKVADVTDKTIVFLASGDLSHYQKDEGPYGYRPEGPEYDKRLLDALRANNLKSLPDFDAKLLEKAGECGHRSFCILAGFLDDEKTRIRVLSHENTFGVGYGFAAIEVEQGYVAGDWRENESAFKEILDAAMDADKISWEEAMIIEMQRYYAAGTGRFTAHMEAAIMESQDKDPYVLLARRTIDALVLGEELPKIDNDIPAELRQKRAGAFVSIHKAKALRGCIGTIIATRKSVADEIIANAISAASQDPRFPKVTAEELPFLEINVDVLTEPEIIPSADMLDPRKYGVIVQNGNRLGVLLPDLEGVDTVEEQISIAMRKAGIDPDEPVELMRFSVERHI